ncbi:MAG: homoprotocatechuate degradation operon regulator HpaR [Rhodobacteraceae bacterium]|nr:homoprotocatechuate degradation operon regulator HpaR [Paracoccaceae bacterium]
MSKTKPKNSANSGLRPTSRALPIALLRTREHIMEPIRPMLAEIGLTEQKWRVLRILTEIGPLEQTAIARHACLLLPSLTRILSRMEADGLIRRAQDPDDKRRSIVQISKQGSALIEAHQPFSNQVYRDLEKKYGREKLDLLLDMLEEIQEIKF